jgi:hypothetical protein
VQEFMWSSMKKISITCIALLCAVAMHAQVNNVKNTEISTIETPTKTKTSSVNPLIKIGAEDLEISEKIWMTTAGKIAVEFYDLHTKKITNYQLAQGLVFATSFKHYVVYGTEQKKPIAFVQIPRYIKNAQGEVLELISYKTKITQTETYKKTRGNRVYASVSALASGTFYKMSITQNAMHKIDYAFVKDSLKIDPVNIAVNNIRIYGNGGTMLSEDNAVPREDDLAENAIELIGMADGKWDSGDYILFYANGPHALVKDSVFKRFNHSFNLYQNECYYFLNFDKGPGKRVPNANAVGAATVQVDSFDAYQFVESDAYNFGRFGKVWWGDRLSTSGALSKTFTFNTAGAVGSKINITSGVGVVSNSGQSKMKVIANGTVVGTTIHNGFSNGYLDPTIDEDLYTSNFINTQGSCNINVALEPGNDFAAGYINYISLNYRSKLVTTPSFMRFRDWQSVGAGAIAQFNLQTSGSPVIWDITDPLRPSKLNTTFNASTLSFTNDASLLREYVLFDGSALQQPKYLGTIANQNLHALNNVNFLVIAHPLFVSEAKRLAQHHANKNGYTTLVVTPQEVYNEFSGGSQDISALRDFAKMFYDKASLDFEQPKHLLLFGDASYDYKNRIPVFGNYVPTFETQESINKTQGYCTDDFFGMLDDNEFMEDITRVNTLDIGVGRIPCNSAAEAKTVVDKILNYESANSYGAWKNNATFSADNLDFGVHLDDAEIMSKVTADSFKRANIYKIYLDAFPLENTAGGARAPQASQALSASIYNGTLLVNYNGHGGPNAWCEERLFNESEITNYTNINKLPLFITATCDFAPFDNPAGVSAGERLLIYDKGGAIALMTTTQLVYQSENRIMNRDYMSVLYKPMNNGALPSLGDAYRLSKNKTYIGVIGNFKASNFRKFALLGDPALNLSIPTLKVVVDSLNGTALVTLTDTIKALKNCTITGRVLDAAGNTNSAFNGTINVTIFDKARNLATLGEGGASSIRNYQLQNAVIFRGSATVSNGTYNIKFVAPKDIDYSYGKGKISLYAYSSNQEAAGSDSNVIIGGLGNANLVDNDAPIVRPFINSNKFINGGVVGKSSTLLVELSDSNGINTTGSAIGHDLTAILDGKTNEPIVLNTFYESAKDNYKFGVVRFPFKDLSEGPHTITVKAWDILNNSGTGTVDFVVNKSEEAIIDRVINYPNPFTTATNFSFDHNQSGALLYITVEVYSVAGTLVKTIKTTRTTESSRITDIAWDGLDQQGDRLGRGTYLYKIYYKSNIGKSAYKYQKLVIL